MYPVFAQELTPPEKQHAEPLISETYANDRDGNRIDDDLFKKAKKAIALELSATGMEERINARAILEGMVNVELVFKERVTQEQIDAFLSMGGTITYIYKTVSYGWNGRIPIGRITELPSVMGPALVLVDEPEKAIRH